MDLESVFAFLSENVVRVGSSLHFAHILAQTVFGPFSRSPWLFLIRMGVQIKDLAQDSWFKLAVFFDWREAWTVRKIL